MKHEWRLFSLLRRVLHDEEGSYFVLMTFLFPLVVGVVGFGAEGGLILYNLQRLQSAADSAAVSAAIAYTVNASADLSTQAKAITATYGFVDGTNNVTVTVNTPPQSSTSCRSSNSTYAGNSAAVEVIVTQPQAPMFSGLWNSSQYNLCGRAVALLTGGDCMLALGKNNGTAIQAGPGQGSINFQNCGIFSNSSSSNSITTQGAATINASSVGTVGPTYPNCSGISNCVGGGNPIADPYANIPVPSATGPCLAMPNNATTIPPGRYCGQTSLGNMTLQSGTYIFDSNKTTGVTLSISGGTVTGTGVTLVFTCSTCASPSQYPSNMMSIGANGNINVSAPSTGATTGVSGIVLFGDRTMPLTTQFDFGANGTASFNGAIYLPNGALTTQTANNGPTVPCTQFIANSIIIKNGSLSAKGCIGNGTTPFGSSAKLVE